MRHSRCWRWLAFTILAYLIVACDTTPQASEATSNPMAEETAIIDTSPMPTSTPPPSVTPTDEPLPGPIPVITPSSPPSTALFDCQCGVSDFAWSPDGTKLVVGGVTVEAISTGDTITIWDAETGEMLNILPQSDHPIEGRMVDWQVNSATNQSLIAAGGWSNIEGPFESVVVWDAETLERIQGFFTTGADVHSVEFSPDGSLLAAGLLGGGDLEIGIQVWDITSGEQRFTFEPDDINIPIDFVEDVAWSPDGNVLALAAGSGNIVLWALDGSQPVRVINQSPGAFEAVDWSPDGSMLASSGVNVIVWDTESYTMLHSFDIPGWIEDIEFSPDGSLLAVGASYTFEDTTFIFDPATGAQLCSFRWGHEVAWSPDGEILATAYLNDTFTLWHFEPWRTDCKSNEK
jgi:WD40 repeat protein